ncbi:MAG: hypothetical protein CFH19_00401 [Alphaproteobacteria bacterium MarineAlpha5_Bin9]|nr:MAG: hypothetical protein CFH19_00401 [Alphaproteobacteria bacterium MarineAlpha5_Bin9]|tara:strand:- start:33996 stop:34235 length:240 start_codon:yes stop_codon:yes gene_type:complete
MKIIIYSKENCPNCLKAKNILSKFNPIILMLGKDITRDEFFNKFPNANQVPQIVINDKHIGGYSDIENWLAFNYPNEDF